MSKHSPGPWKVEIDTSLGMGESHAQPWKIVDATKRTLMCDTKYYPWCPEKEADWQLIAAAPELLNACEAALHDRMYKDWPAVADLLMAAIAKARGEEKDRSLKP